MNIVFVSPFPPLKDGLAGYTRQFVDELRAKGHDVGIVASTDVGFSPRKLRAIRTYLLQRRPDVVHVQYTIPAFGLAVFPLWLVLRSMRRKLGFQLVVTFHEVKRETALLGAAGALYIRFVAALADHVAVHTKEAVGLLQTHCHVPKNKITHLPHPLYIYEQTSGSVSELRKTNKVAGKQVILFFGYIHVDKGVDHLVKAFARARETDKKMADTVLVIAGSVRKRDLGLFKLFEKKDRQYEAHVHQLVAKLGLGDAVRFIPYVPDADVAGWFKLATCVVLPYTNLEQSGVLNVALGCRTPIIASKLGGLGETLAGTQALFPAGDDQALAKKLRTYVTKPEVARSVVAAYKTIRASREIAVVANGLVSMYHSLPNHKTPSIIYVVPNYPPHLGGTEQVAQYIAEGLAARGEMVSVFTTRDIDQSTATDVRLHSLRSFSFAHSTFLPGLFWALARAPRPRLMHIHYSGELGTTETAAFVARLRRIPYIVHVHTDPTPSGILGMLLPAYKKAVLGSVLRRTPAIIVLTDAGKKAFAKTYKLQPRRIAVLPNAVRDMFFAPHPATSTKQLRVLYVGRLSAEKDVALIVKAVAQLQNVTLDIVGDGELRSELTTLAAELNAPVTFWGAQFGEQLVARYQAADVFCLASQHEQFGIVLLEAMASQLAVVASDIPGVRTVAKDVAVLVKPHTAEAFAAAIGTFQKKPSALKQGRKASLERAGQYTTTTVIDMLQTIYARQENK